MNDLIIRPLTKDDVAGAAEIKVNGWKTAYKGIIDDSVLNGLSYENYKIMFENFVGDETFLVAVLDGKVVGYCRYSNESSSSLSYVDCELVAIYVHPNFKGKGIGTKMFNYVINLFNNQNKDNMILWCLEDNIDSLRFYENMGGEIQDTKVAQIGDKNYKELGIVYNIKKLCKIDEGKKL